MNGAAAAAAATGSVAGAGAASAAAASATFPRVLAKSIRCSAAFRRLRAPHLTSTGSAVLSTVVSAGSSAISNATAAAIAAAPTAATKGDCNRYCCCRMRFSVAFNARCLVGQDEPQLLMQQQCRALASLSRAAQHKKRMRRILEKRMRWKPPHVPQEYLRTEADFNVLSIQRPPVDFSHAKKRAAAAARPVPIYDLNSPEYEKGTAQSAHESDRQQQQQQHEQQFLQRRLLKPHEVAKLLKEERRIGGPPDDKPSAAELARHAGNLPALSSAAVKPLSGEDVDWDSRPEAKDFGSDRDRVFKTKGVYAENDVEYYRRFFKDRYRRLDGRGKEVESLLKKREAEDALVRARKRPYVPPKKHWYGKPYTSPAPSCAQTMQSQALKFALMNEARLVKLGLKPLDLTLWRAFEARLLQLAGPRTRVRAPMLLRALHAISKIQYAALSQTLEGVIRGLMFREPTLKPQHYVFLFQALARLRYRHVYTLHALKEMMVSWPVLRNNFLLKAANALAKLDLSSHVLCKPLQLTLATRIPGFTAANCRRVKWITALDFFSEAMITSFLCRCEQQQTGFRKYSRNLQVIELYLRLEKPEVYELLPLIVQYFLERTREVHTEDAKRDDDCWTDLSSSSEEEEMEKEESEEEGEESENTFSRTDRQIHFSKPKLQDRSEASLKSTFNRQKQNQHNSSLPVHSATPSTSSGAGSRQSLAYDCKLSPGSAAVMLNANTNALTKVATHSSAPNAAIDAEAETAGDPLAEVELTSKPMAATAAPTGEGPSDEQDKTSQRREVLSIRLKHREADDHFTSHSSGVSPSEFLENQMPSSFKPRLGSVASQRESGTHLLSDRNNSNNGLVEGGNSAAPLPSMTSGNGEIEARHADCNTTITNNFSSQLYSSLLHADVSRLLLSMGIPHLNSVYAGPLKVDMYHPGTNTIVETCPAFQFYRNSAQFTALSKRRHQLLLTMGFQLILIPYQRWSGLCTDEEKHALLRSLLPPDILEQ